MNLFVTILMFVLGNGSDSDEIPVPGSYLLGAGMFYISLTAFTPYHTVTILNHPTQIHVAQSLTYGTWDRRSLLL